MRKLRNLRRREEGQGMTEYIIIVGVIAVLMIIVVNKYGSALSDLFTSSTSEITTTSNTVGGASDASAY